MTITKYKNTHNCLCGNAWTEIVSQHFQKPKQCPKCNGHTFWIVEQESFQHEMTDKDIAEETEALLSDIPVELRSTLSYMAYERGHSSGEMEVFNILQEMVSNLKKPLEELCQRVYIEGIAKGKKMAAEEYRKSKAFYENA